MSTENIKVAHYPDYRDGNPYQSLLAKSLEKAGIKSTFIKSKVKSLLKHSYTGNQDILHLHWIHEPITKNSTKVNLIIQLLMFHTALIIWKTRGKKIVWTMHNLSDHEKKRPKIDWLHSKIISYIAQNIIIHSENGSLLAAKKFQIPASKISVCYHGNYNDCIKAHPPNSSRGVNFLFIGQIRAYKGVIELIKSFKQVTGPHKLYICGKPQTQKIIDEVLFECKSDTRITHDLSFVSDEKLEELFTWSHITVLPYRDVFTSGSVLLSLSAARPIISPRCGVIPEYVNENCSILYEPNDELGLKQSLKAATLITDFSNMSSAASLQAKLFDWNDSAKILADIYSE